VRIHGSYHPAPGSAKEGSEKLAQFQPRKKKKKKGVVRGVKQLSAGEQRGGRSKRTSGKKKREKRNRHERLKIPEKGKPRKKKTRLAAVSDTRHPFGQRGEGHGGLRGGGKM